MFALITYTVKGYDNPASQLFRIEKEQDEVAIAAAFTKAMNPVQVHVVNVNLNYSQIQTIMPVKTPSMLSLHALWRTCYRLRQSIEVYQKRSQLLQMEVKGITETQEQTAIVDPRIENLQKALTEAIPLFKNELAQQAFEESLLGEDVEDSNRTDF